MMTLLLLLALQDRCVSECPAMQAYETQYKHPTRFCVACNAGLQEPVQYCTPCAKKAGVCRGCGAKPVKVEKSWTGQDSKIEKPEFVRVTTAEEWRELWKRNGSEGDAPEVDFTKSVIVVSVAGSSTRPTPSASAMRPTLRGCWKWSTVIGEKRLAAFGSRSSPTGRV